MIPNGYITIGQAAKRLGVTYRQVRRLVAEGKLKAKHISTGTHDDGRIEWVVSSSSVDSWPKRKRTARQNLRNSGQFGTKEAA